MTRARCRAESGAAPSRGPTKRSCDTRTILGGQTWPRSVLETQPVLLPAATIQLLLPGQLPKARTEPVAVLKDRFLSIG